MIIHSDTPERWRPIKDFPMYKISDRGRVQSLYGKNRILKQHLLSSGYHDVRIVSPNGNLKSFLIHRLLLEAFDKSRPDGLVANHKNGIKTDNRISNLEWVTQKENVKHAFDNELRHVTNQTPVYQYTINGDFVAKYESFAEAQRKTGIHRTHMGACCRKYRHQHTAGGYVWKYAEDK